MRARPTPVAPASAAEATRVLQRAAPLLRLSTSPHMPPEVVADGRALRCTLSGQLYPYTRGVLNLLPHAQPLTLTQQTLNTRLTAWAYDRLRGVLLRLASSPAFPQEVAFIQERLQVEPGDTVLDLACGHGNFTVEWATRVGPQGLVIGLDLSPAMLARAAHHVQAWGLDNVLLIRGDAHQLPFADGSLHRVNCSGGFHQFPDLPQALRELARTSAPGAILTASTFAVGPEDRWLGFKRWLGQRFELHFISLPGLGEQLSALNYEQYEWSLPGGWFGYTSARKAA